MHLMVVAMMIALMWHQVNVTIFCLTLLLIYCLDRAYMVLFKTCMRARTRL